MKKQLVSLIAMLVLSSNIFANDDVYIGGGLALQDAMGYDTGVSIVLNFGVGIDDIEVEEGNFGLEGELTHSIFSPSLNSVDVDFSSLAGYLTYFVDVNSNVYAKSKLGLLYISSDGYDGVKPSLGIGLGYKYSNSVNFYTDYTILTSIVSNLTFGIQLKLSGL